MPTAISNANGDSSSMGRLQAPVRPRNRIITIDILRGFAIFGILLVNMEFFNQSALNYVAELYEPSTMFDQLARWFIAFFAEGKFYSIFSFLFGLGMAIQYLRAVEKGARFGPFWLRRMLVLLGIGLIHAYLFWPGDILIMYSVLGIALLLWRKAKPRTLLIWTFIFLLLPLLLNTALFGLVKMGEMAMGREEMARVLDEQIANYAALGVQADQVYTNGNFIEVTAQRARDMMFMYSTWPFMGFNVLAMMILGLYVGKRHIFEDIPGNMLLIRKVWLWGLIIGLIGNFVYVYFGEQANRAVPSLANLISLTGQIFGAPALALFYMTSLTMLAERADWRRRLQPLAKVGRMALTNYLLQSAICSILFFGYGFGLYGQIGIAAGILLTIVIYAAEVVFSIWWLARFRFGPMEWLWRTLSYGKRQPMRREAFTS
ncbi:MAG: DUF418 domain-containing protein [Chloroflexota bacterium]|nr:DUF418 domain-containing protein [Chloroflexota bacterium]